MPKTALSATYGGGEGQARSIQGNSSRQKIGSMAITAERLSSAAARLPNSVGGTGCASNQGTRQYVGDWWMIDGRQWRIGPLKKKQELSLAGSLTLSSFRSVFAGGLSLAHCVHLPRPPTVSAGLNVRAFSPEQQVLVNESWKTMKKDAGTVAVNFFLKIFEIAPSVKKLFSFTRDSELPLEKNPLLKTHALLVLKTTGDAATQLGQKGALQALRPVLVELGRTHVDHGVIDEHFDVVKYALLRTIEESLPGPGTKEVVAAWSEAYDELVNIIRAEMQATRLAQTHQKV